MNDNQNPFEAMMNAGGNIDPFGGIAAPAIDLGSEASAGNPFDIPGSPQNMVFGSESTTESASTDPMMEAAATPPAGNLAPTPMTAPPLPNQPLPATGPNGQTQSPPVTVSPQALANQAPAQTALFPAQPANPPEISAEGTSVIAQLPLFARPPVFEHGAVKEDIEDLTQTFEDLRVAKMEDFPELEDGIRVTWDVTYGKIRKSVGSAEAKKKIIGEFKAAIETSKEFTDNLKKSKEKSPVCIIKPRVTAQSKGERLPIYKGVCTTLDEAEDSGKAICIVPGNDGKVYEIRNEEMGVFVTPTSHCRELSEIKAGFTPALPLIPHYELRRIIGFFRSLMSDGGNYEAIANILWDKELEEFHTVIPRQLVTAVRADSDLTLAEDYEPGRFLHYMDVHSHNIMPARFSVQDNIDEKATRLYAVLGRLDEFIPELSVRISNGGKYLLIDPAIVFESFGDFYPEEWNERVTLADKTHSTQPSGSIPFHGPRMERYPSGAAA